MNFTVFLFHYLTSSFFDFLVFNPFLILISFGILTNNLSLSKKKKRLLFIFVLLLIIYYIHLLIYHTHFFGRVFFHNLLLIFFTTMQVIFVRNLQLKNFENFFSKFLKNYLIGFFLIHVYIICSLDFISNTVYYVLIIPLYLLKYNLMY